MANKKITELSMIDSLSSIDVFEVVDDPTGTPTSKKATVAQMRAGMQPALISGTSIKTINGMSVLGSGDIVIVGGGDGTGDEGGGPVNVVDATGGILVHDGDGVTPGKITAGNIEATTGFSAKTGYGNERIETGSTELPVGGKGFYIYNYGGSAALILRTDNVGKSHISTLGGGDIIVPNTPTAPLKAFLFNANGPGAIYGPSFAVQVGDSKESGLYNPTSGSMGLIASRVEVVRCNPDSVEVNMPLILRYATSNTVQTVGAFTQSWVDSTFATRKGQVEEKVHDYNGAHTVARSFANGTNGYKALKVLATAPADGDLVGGEVVFHTDGSGNLLIKLKDSGGTVRTGTITLT